MGDFRTSIAPHLGGWGVKSWRFGVRNEEEKGRMGEKENMGKEEFKRRRRRPNILDYVFRRIA
jgi:hypothetical protein